jgi:hypothetical protein
MCKKLNILGKACMTIKNFGMKLKLPGGLVYIKKTSPMKKFILLGGIP